VTKLSIDEFFSSLNADEHRANEAAVQNADRLTRLHEDMRVFVRDVVAPLFEHYRKKVEEKGWWVESASHFGVDSAYASASFALAHNSTGPRTLSFGFDHSSSRYDLVNDRGRYPGGIALTREAVEDELQRFIKDHWYYGTQHFEKAKHGGVRMRTAAVAP
jgi:predicted LPLAT superfamily acyltransferase